MKNISTKRQSPRGMLRVWSSFGFRRNVDSPALPKLVEKYPALQKVRGCVEWLQERLPKALLGHCR